MDPAFLEYAYGFPRVNLTFIEAFPGRISFSEVDQLYRRSVATMLLLPARYPEDGHMTQRLPEAVWAGCLPITPAGIRGADRFTLDALNYDDGWNPTPMVKFTDLQRDVVAADRWIIEGNYASTLPIRLECADSVLFLDLPARTCL
jgi:hypothetical protein